MGTGKYQYQQDTRQILPYEDVVKVLDNFEYYSVSDCPCRHRKNLDEEILGRMSDHAQVLTRASRFGISGTWKLLRYVYADNRLDYSQEISKKRHVCL